MAYDSVAGENKKALAYVIACGFWQNNFTGCDSSLPYIPGVGRG